MMHIKRGYFDDCTIGRLSIEGFNCLSLELPWLNNQQDISCIPEGLYKYFLRRSPQNGMVLELRDVENRTCIQMHSANFTYEILGCIAVGDGLKYLDGDDILDTTNSVKTMKKILKLAGNSGHITID